MQVSTPVHTLQKRSTPVNRTGQNVQDFIKGTSYCLSILECGLGFLIWQRLEVTCSGAVVPVIVLPNVTLMAVAIGMLMQ